jgi:FkbM family methyltransferase
MTNNYNKYFENPAGHNMDVLVERFSHIIDKIDTNSIKTLFEIGSLDCWESVNLARMFPQTNIHAFEPVPLNIKRCKETLSSHTIDITSRIFLHEIAMNNKTGQMEFWALDPVEASKKSNTNHGIGSKLKLINPDMWHWEHNVQKSIMVQGYRLEDWCNENNILNVDGIWMDAQGAELDILEGMGTLLNGIQFIMTEAGLKPYYYGHNMKKDIDKYLLNYGFTEITSATKQNHEYECDVIYLNSNLIK